MEEFTPRRRRRRDIRRGVTQFEPVYRIVDADTGQVMDDNKGFGFQKNERVLIQRQKRVASVRSRVESWLEEHPAEGAFLFEVLFDTEIGWYGDVPIDDIFVAEILEPFGLESPAPAGDLHRVLAQLVGKYQSGEICRDSSLADEYRLGRARAQARAVEQAAFKPKLTLIKGGKERGV